MRLCSDLPCRAYVAPNLPRVVLYGGVFSAAENISGMAARGAALRREQEITAKLAALALAPSKHKFSQTVVGLGNKDKEDLTESWKEKPRREPGSIPHPFRAFLCGPPNSGKSLIAQHLALLWPSPLFEKVTVIHCDPENTREWDFDGVEVVGEPPQLEELTKADGKQLLIFDDFPLNKLKGDSMVNVDRILGYASSHIGISVIICSQRPFTCPVELRQYCNVFCLWKQADSRLTSQIEDITSLPRGTLTAIFSSFTKATDCVMVDMTHDTPFPLRAPDPVTPIAL